MNDNIVDEYVSVMMGALYKLLEELGDSREPLDGDEVDDVVEQLRNLLNIVEGNN